MSFAIKSLLNPNLFGLESPLLGHSVKATLEPIKKPSHKAKRHKSTAAKTNDKTVKVMLHCGCTINPQQKLLYAAVEHIKREHPFEKLVSKRFPCSAHPETDLFSLKSFRAHLTKLHSHAFRPKKPFFEYKIYSGGMWKEAAEDEAKNELSDEEIFKLHNLRNSNTPSELIVEKTIDDHTVSLSCGCKKRPKRLDSVVEHIKREHPIDGIISKYFTCLTHPEAEFFSLTAYKRHLSKRHPNVFAAKEIPFKYKVFKARKWEDAPEEIIEFEATDASVMHAYNEEQRQFLASNKTLE